MTGGGSGGHITPILAVADELKSLRPDIKLVYIGQKGDKLADIPVGHGNIDEVYTVRAGKFRRYHGQGLKQLLDVRTLLKNIRDFFFVIAGFWQSYWLLKKLKPAGMFVKGGYIAVPVGLAAGLSHIPYVTHDSDIVPGLANRIISRWAKAHAVALPKEVYNYPTDKTFTVGVPVSAQFKPVTNELQTSYRRETKLDDYKEIILVTGGGLGALSLNESFAKISPELLSAYPELCIINSVGRDHTDSISKLYDNLLTDSAQRKRVIIRGFIGEFYKYSGAADVIVCRAGATNLAEFAVQRKACVVVPNPILTGGHQTKNAQYMSEQRAIVVVNEDQLNADSKALLDGVKTLINNPKERRDMGERLGKFALPGATKQLAELILDSISK